MEDLAGEAGASDHGSMSLGLWNGYETGDGVMFARFREKRDRSIRLCLEVGREMRWLSMLDLLTLTNTKRRFRLYVISESGRSFTLRKYDDEAEAILAKRRLECLVDEFDDHVCVCDLSKWARNPMAFPSSEATG